MDISKLKVAELKQELHKLNLPVSGVKAVLVQRLEAALSGGQGEVISSSGANDSQEIAEDSQSESVTESHQSMVENVPSSLDLDDIPIIQVQTSPRKQIAPPPEVQLPVSTAEVVTIPQPAVIEPTPIASQNEMVSSGDEPMHEAEAVESVPSMHEEQPPITEAECSTSVTAAGGSMADSSDTAAPCVSSGVTGGAESEVSTSSAAMKSEPVELPCAQSMQDVHVASEVDSTRAEESDVKPMDTSETGENGTEVKSEAKVEASNEADATSSDRTTVKREERKRRRSRSRSRSPRSRKSRSRSRERRRSRSREKRHRSRSKSRSPPTRRPRQDSEQVLSLGEEPIGWDTRTDVFLDWYNSDLNLLIDPNGYRAKPISYDGFGFMWAGARAAYGVTEGRVFYEVKIVDNIKVNLGTEMVGVPNVCRVGWSVDASKFELGEEKFSYGYGGTAKKSTNSCFLDYGKKFGVDNVVGAFLEFTETEVVISFTVDGDWQGECYRLSKSELNGAALFPHIFLKNIEVECNFGGKTGAETKPWFPLDEKPDEGLSEFVLIGQIPSEQRVRGTPPPQVKEECEMVMMCGLPGCGKSVWAEKHAAAHPEKRYAILGTNLILEKMKVMGLNRRRNYAGRWEVLIDKSTKCLNKLIDMASRRRRNYILDQTNVYASAQRRKMRPFDGYRRKSVVIVPTDEEFRRRIDQRTKEEGKDVPESAVLEMKANFKIPRDGDLFEEILFPELNRVDSEALVNQYNQEGVAAVGPPKGPRQSRFDRPSGGSRGSQGSDSRRERDDRRDRDSRGDSRDRGRDSRGSGRDYGRSRDFDRGSRNGDRGSRFDGGDRSGDRGGDRFRGGRGGGDRGGGGFRGGFDRGSRDRSGFRGGADRSGGGFRGSDRGGRGGGFGGGGFRGSPSGGRQSGFSATPDSGFGGQRGGDYGGPQSGGYGGFSGQRSGFGGQQGGYGGQQSGYGGQQSGYGGQQGGYGGQQSGYGGQQSGYGGQQSGYGGQQGGFGGQQSGYGAQQSGYGGQQGGFGGQQSGYGAQQSGYGSQQSSDSTSAPSQPAYGSQAQTYGASSNQSGAATQAYDWSSQSYGAAGSGGTGSGLEAALQYNAMQQQPKSQGQGAYYGGSGGQQQYGGGFGSYK